MQRKWLALINISIQMGVIIFIFSEIGHWIDETHPSNKIDLHKVFLLVGVALALYNVIRQVKQIDK